jgi:diacylglycerol O-acyltransferase
MTHAQLNRRLTTQDASFLYFERPNQPMHGVGVAVYEGHLTLDDVIRVTGERLHLLPRYRQKLVFPPFGIAHPTWEDDPDFDLRHHITEDTLPPPGDDRAVASAVARQLVPPLPRDRPLWKMVVLHGRADGNTAILSMVHHAMIDGVSGVDLMLVMHDLTPDAAPPPSPATPWQPAPRPDPIALLQDAVRDQLVEAAQRWTDDTFRQYRPGEAAARAQQISTALAASLPSMLQPAPRTPFNGPISRERAVSWAQFSFTEVRAIRAVLGGTVNDVVLAVVAGAIGRYLRHHGHRTEGVELRAMCPVSMRQAEGRGTMGNQVSMMIAPLFVGILDPVERLAAERTAMERLKQQDQAGGFYAMTEQGNQVPPWQQALAGQVEVPNTLLNTVSTNVPGPQIPLYMRGRKMLAYFGFGMLSANIGLFNAIGSYNQVLTIGATVDPKLVPDVWFYADCLRESFAELRGAAERVAAASGTPSPTATAAAAAMPVPAGRAARTDRQPATIGASPH